MPRAQHEVIAAMAASAALGGAPLNIATDRGAWDRAVAAHAAAHRGLSYNCDEAQDEPLGDAFADATTAMITTPAPDHPALLFKLEYLFGDDSTAAYCEDWMRAVMADAHRLLWNGRA